MAIDAMAGRRRAGPFERLRANMVMSSVGARHALRRKPAHTDGLGMTAVRTSNRILRPAATPTKQNALVPGLGRERGRTAARLTFLLARRIRAYPRGRSPGFQSRTFSLLPAWQMSIRVRLLLRLPIAQRGSGFARRTNSTCQRTGRSNDLRLQWRVRIGISPISLANQRHVAYWQPPRGMAIRLSGRV